MRSPMAPIKVDTRDRDRPCAELVASQGKVGPRQDTVSLATQVSDINDVKHKPRSGDRTVQWLSRRASTP